MQRKLCIHEYLEVLTTTPQASSDIAKKLGIDQRTVYRSLKYFYEHDTQKRIKGRQLGCIGTGKNGMWEWWK